MPVANLHMGYVGSVKINGTNYFMSGSSLNPTQAVEAPDLVAGSIMRRGWAYGKVDPAGNVSGPLHENATSLWKEAFDRTDEYDHLVNDDIEVEIHFYKGGGWKFSNCVINSLNIAATAGEYVNFTADFAGKNIAGCTSGDSTPIDCAKLMTWDRVTFDVIGVSGLDYLQSLNFTLNNNVQKIYAIRNDGEASNLYPIDLPCGVREITGSISAYAQQPICNFLNDNIGADSWCDYTATEASKNITFSVGGCGGGDIMAVDFQAVFSRPEGSGQTGPAVYNLNFTAVCEPSATITA
jgi:hypothetical protein